MRNEEQPGMETMFLDSSTCTELPQYGLNTPRLRRQKRPSSAGCVEGFKPSFWEQHSPSYGR